MRSTSRTRPQKTPAERAEILTAYRHTALSSQQFARQHGIATSTLFRWLRQSPVSGKCDSAEWIEVPNLLGNRPPVPSYRLCFTNGVSFEIAAGFQAEEVRLLAEMVSCL